MKVFIIFTLYLISVTGVSTNKVTAYSGGGVMIKCKYHEGYETNNKYFCKEKLILCDDQIKTDDKNMWVHEGRFSLYDNTSAKVFWVLMRNLTVEDTGTYQCAVDKYLQTDTYTAVKVKVIAAGGVASKEVTAYAGGGVNIKCKYEDEYKTKLKYFCKIGNDHWCLDQITTNPNTDWTHQLRSSVHDHRSAGFFSVFIRELSVNDSGTYQCGVVVSDQLHTYTGVKVNVTEDLNYGRSISETGYRGGTVNISCKYPESQRSDPKFLCKIVGTDVCAYKTSVKESGRWINEGCMSLYDDRTTLLFTVTIRELTGSGTYWCGAESDWESDHGYKVYITQIYLTVTELQVPALSVSSSCSSPRSTVLTTSKTTVTSSPIIDTSTDIAVSNLSPHPSSHFSPQATQLTTSSSSTPTSSSSPATGSPSSTVISVLSVILVLLLMGTSFLIVTLRKRRKTQASSKGQSFHKSSDSCRVSFNGCDYEEIKDTRSHSLSDIGASTVYSTVCLPTNPSDPSQTIYAQGQLPTNPSDPSQTVYTLVQPPSHFHDMDIYSTAQLPTIPFASSVGPIAQLASTSAEGLTYAAVKFHNEANSSKHVTREMFKKEHDSCDYATVNHDPGGC
ncbi:polymeric immunoglobulin receptor-like isoform X1 [Brachyhypopomus gauderio]|uniref:polymeric immunoglobulin receptor-like isoform X1 n=1 Tax=Brachyhypopomus gauderio TaxID=698409 RepID=UPI0040424A77